MMRGWKEAIAAMLIAASFGCSAKEAGPKSGPRTTVGGVPVESVVRSGITDEAVAVGTVRARNSAVLLSRLPGTVRRVDVREGDRVGKGRLLVLIDAEETSAQAGAASATVDEARRALAQAEARKRLADVTFQRYRNLFDQQAATRQELDTRRAEMDVAEQERARAASGLEAARKSSEAASAAAGHARIVAPFAGVITARAVDPGATVFPGTHLVTLEEEGKYQVDAAVPESLVGRLAKGGSVRVDLGGGKTLDGTVAEIVPTADPATRTFTAKVEISCTCARSGTFARVLIPAGQRKGIVVPASAVIDREGLTSVWVVDPRSTARMRLVKLGKREGDKIEVLAGLSEGERIITGSLEKVVEGALVETR